MSVDTLREKFHINRINTSDLQDFLTAQTYRPEITQAKNHILSLRNCSLQSFCTKPIQQGKSPKYAETGLKCIKPKNTNDMLVSVDDIDWIDWSTKDQIQKQKLAYGDIVITRSGSGTIGRASIYCYEEDAYTNDHLFIVRPDKADSHYICAFLKSFHGQRLLEAGISGSTGQLNLSNEHIKSIPLFKPDDLVQKYIGDKVRQARKLRAWAKRLEMFIDDKFSFLVQDLPSPKKYFSVMPENLAPYRINPKQYDPVVTGAISKAEKSDVLLERLEDLIDARGIAGGATPKGADYKTSGVLFCRVQNVKKLALDMSDAVYICKDDDETLKRSRCKSYDIVLTITGYPGTASLVIEEDLPVNLNQHSVRFGCTESIKPGYLCAAVNSSFVKLQVDRASIGGTRDALDYPSVANLLIPRLDATVEEAIHNATINFVRAIKSSKLLTDTAKTLVEALIEGQLTEKQIIQAQQALDDGDNRLDQAILSKLSNEGYAIAGATPLFSDIDELYRLLESATQAEADV